MSKLRLVVLESDDADGNAIGAIVGVLREMNITRAGGGDLETHLAEPEAPRALALPETKARKPRAPKASATNGEAKRSRVSGAGDSVLAAFRRSSRPDLGKLAAAVYADSSKVAKVKQVIGYLVKAGKLNDHKDGSYSVV